MLIFGKMKIVVTAATQKELQPVEESFRTIKPANKEHQFTFKTSGPGLLATAVNLSEIFHENAPDLCIQIGIAGSFDTEIPPAEVVAVKEEMLGDLGVEEQGVWNDIFDLKLADENEPPFAGKMILNTGIADHNLTGLRLVRGLTINQITTGHKRIEELKYKYKADIETMEGAAFHYVCKKRNISFIQIRAISNYVGERNKENWLFDEALQNLQLEMKKYFELLTEKK